MNNIKQQHQKYPLEFTGSGGEFFKIWIVNVMLSIVTLGIYSAWAKVRTKRYFYGNTLLMGTAFDYLGDPLKILKGRLVAFAVFVAYAGIGKVSPIAQAVLTLFLYPFIPWVVIKSLRFNAYNSAYRNIRFTFEARYGEAFKVFLLLPLLTAFTAGLAYPIFVRAHKKFVIDHTTYGMSPFEMNATNGQFYGVYIRAFGIWIVSTAILAIVGYALMSGVLPENPAEKTKILIGGLVWIIFPVIMLVAFYLMAAVNNLTFNSTVLGQHHFESHLKFGTLCWIGFSNLIAIVFSVGLLVPWAKIRVARYRISCISVCVNGNVDEFIAAETERIQAIGEEIGDMFDMDIGL